MNSVLSVVMYHYVREIKNSKFPGIRGLEMDDFIEQIKYLKKHYNIISVSDLIASQEAGESLPENPLMLTFDDGYIDHFENVLPVLDEHKLSGSFYIPAKTVEESMVLDVNKIHYVLASCNDEKQLLKDVFDGIDLYRAEYANLPANEQMFEEAQGQGNRYDSKEVVFVKQALQRRLPAQLRDQIINKLLEKYLGLSERELSQQLYMSPEQLTQMQNANMTIGAHGYEHVWLGSVPTEKKKLELELSNQFLDKLKVPKDERVICYPYGSCDQEVVDFCKELGFKIGFTTEVRLADLRKDSLLTLPRLDTNDFPKNSTVEPNKWYYEAQI